jgi:molybdate transport system substrate-binding protein
VKEEQVVGTRVRGIQQIWTALLGATLLTMAAAGASAADLVFLCPGALAPTANDVVPEFQNVTGQPVATIVGSVGAHTERIRKGEPADMVVVSARQWEDLEREGKIDPAVRTVIARVGIGIFVKQGSPKPAIATVDDFKRELLKVRSIALGDPANGSPVGSYAMGLFERLGIRSDVEPKLRLIKGLPIKAVASGEAELGLAQISEIVSGSDVELVGPLPADVQNTTEFIATIPKQASNPRAAKELIELFRSPKTVSLMRVRGLEAQ